MGFKSYAEGCPNRVKLEVERRPGNALNVEVGTPAPRCKLQTPEHWGKAPSVARWLASGGSALVLGRCAAGACPLKPRHCSECGHRAEFHSPAGCLVKNSESPFPCGCETPQDPRPPAEE